MKLERVAREAAERAKPSPQSPKYKIPKKPTTAGSPAPIVLSPRISSSDASSRPSPTKQKKQPIVQSSKLKRDLPRDAEDAPSKRIRVAPESTDVVKSASMVSGIFAFAKSVVRSVATSLTASAVGEHQPQNESLNNNNNVDLAVSNKPFAFKLESKCFEFPPKQDGSASNKPFEFKTESSVAKRFEFQPKLDSALGSPFRFSATAAASPGPDPIASLTPANDRLARLRQTLEKNRQAKLRLEKEQPVAAVDMDDVMMTDDEDAAQSDVTNDTDDGNHFGSVLCGNNNNILIHR